MLSKKTATETAATKIGVLGNKKKKAGATFEFSKFQDEIQVQAYYNYLIRMNNNMPGSEMTDWLEAEMSVRSKVNTH